MFLAKHKPKLLNMERHDWSLYTFGPGEETKPSSKPFAKQDACGEKSDSLDGQRESLRDLTSVWSGEVQTQNPLSSATLTYHLRPAERLGLKVAEVVSRRHNSDAAAASLSFTISTNPAAALRSLNTASPSHSLRTGSQSDDGASNAKNNWAA